MSRKRMKKTNVNNNKQTVRLAWAFQDEVLHAWDSTFAQARRNQSRILIPDPNNLNPLQWDEPIDVDDPETWVSVSLETLEPRPGVNWADGWFRRTRFDGHNFWLVDEAGEIIEPDRGAAFSLEDSNRGVKVNESWRDEVLSVSSPRHQLLTADRHINVHELTKAISLGEDFNALTPLMDTLTFIEVGDPWFPVREAILNLQHNPTLEAILEVSDAIDKAVDATVRFEV